MQLLLARHGNTFGPGERVVWVGKNQDLHLVERGREQAVEFASAIERAGKHIVDVRCGPLARTREFAEIIVDRLGLPAARIDERLDELDYGRWSGMTRAEILERFGPEELDAWAAHSRWPRRAGFGSDSATVLDEVRSLAFELTSAHREAEGDAAALLVSSNGRLRYFLGLVPGEFERRTLDGTFAVGTGRACRIDVSRDGRTAAALRYWNRDPNVQSELPF
ncbi:MAG: histidine phosphatase family protein [Planctomycetes bacterium]|nr:histidine phosphatase family protein [Planctomycetota bacterium]MCB9891880.1 histidine phosphatase family protein [Planctomycetota bacterium]MCB9919859.1 histidine phosphatase family protein [Planctomycetota bacterium]